MIVDSFTQGALRLRSGAPGKLGGADGSGGGGFSVPT